MSALDRRDFVGALAGFASMPPAMMAFGTAESAPLEQSIGQPLATVRDAFPALAQRINGQPLVYLDTAATALRPNAVIDAVAAYYRAENANPGAALHTLARRSFAAQEAARRTAATFIGATDPLEVVFTRGTTEGINLVASTWGLANVAAGDEILIGMAEHASNMLPWRELARRTGARLVTFDVDRDGRLSVASVTAKLTSRTRVVAFSHVSNVLGMVNPVSDISAAVRAPNRIVVVDGAQSVPHIAVDVRQLGCDFLAFSSHKMLGPMGVGVLWGRRPLLDAMPPYQFGSNMAHDVDLAGEHVSEGALKFGAGTPNVAGPVGLAAAMRFLGAIGWTAIAEHERSINRRMMERLDGIRGVRLLGTREPDARVGVFSFAVEGLQPAALVTALDAEGIAIRAGDLASLPLLRHLGLTVAARASCYVYTTTNEIDRFADALARVAHRA